jgi:hypothetical protein
MKQIAARTVGLYFEAKTTAELDDIYSRIASGVESVYLLRVISEESSNDADFHKVEPKSGN